MYNYTLNTVLKVKKIYKFTDFTHVYMYSKASIYLSINLFVFFFCLFIYLNIFLNKLIYLFPGISVNMSWYKK